MNKVFFDGLGLRPMPMHYELNLLINLHWAEGLEGGHPPLFNLVEDPETGESTQWDFQSYGPDRV